MPDNFVVRSAILCDEVRQEKNDKYIIIGVYPNGITVQSYPANLSISLYIEMIISEPGEHQIDINFIADASRANAEISVLINDATHIVCLPTPKLPLKFDGDSDLVIEVGLNGGQKVEIARRPITSNPNIWSLYPTEIEQLIEPPPTDAQGS